VDITDQMLKHAVVKSVEAGLLPRRALREEFDDAQNLMRMILQSALSNTGIPQETGASQPNPRSGMAFF
jgi:hypothetical protein